VLTLRDREGVRRQRISDQVDRKVADTIEIVKVVPGSGV
jgi:NADH-quinone oxidoreductase subunit J